MTLRLVTSQVGGCVRVTVGLVSGSHDIPKAGHISGGWVCLGLGLGLVYCGVVMCWCTVEW